MSILKPCPSSDAFEFVPESKRKINLKNIAKKFTNIKINTDIVVVVVYNGIDVSIYPSGRMLIHTGNKEKAMNIASALKRIIYE